MQFLKQLIPNSKFSKNILVLVSGTTIAQSVSVILYPVFSRIYTPEDFGVFSLFSAIVAIMSVISAGRYDMAMLATRRINYTINLAAIAICCSLLLATAASIIVIIFRDNLALALRQPKLSLWLCFIPISILTAGLYQVLIAWFNRHKQYKTIATAEATQSLIMAFSNLVLGLAGLGTGGLVFSTLGAQIINTSLLAKKAAIRITSISLRRMRCLLIKYLDFPRKSAVGGGFNALSYQAEYFLFPFFYDLTSLGLYYLANKIASLPKAFFSKAIWQVFLGENIGNNREDIFNHLFYYQKKILLFTTFPLFSSLLFMPQLIAVILGKSWENITPFFYPLFLAAHIHIVVASFSLFILLNRPDAEMKFNVAFASAKVLSIILANHFLPNFFCSVVAISIVQMGIFLLIGSWNYVQLGRNRTLFLSLYFGSLAKIIPYFGTLLLLTTMIDNLVVNTAIIFLSNLIYFYVLKWRSKYC